MKRHRWNVHQGHLSIFSRYSIRISLFSFPPFPSSFSPPLPRGRLWWTTHFSKITESSSLVAKFFSQFLSQWFPNQSSHQNHLQVVWNHGLLGPTPVSDSVGLVCGGGWEFAFLTHSHMLLMWGVHFENPDLILFCPGVDPVSCLPKSYPLIPADRALSCSGSIERFFDFSVRLLPQCQKMMMMMGLNQSR